MLKQCLPADQEDFSAITYYTRLLMEPNLNLPSNSFFDIAHQILTWEIDGKPLPKNRQTIIRQDFWEHIYIKRRQETSHFERFLSAQEDLMLLSGNVGVGKSTYIRQKFEAEQLCQGIIFDMVGRIGALTDAGNLHNDLRKLIKEEYRQCLINNFKASLVSKRGYRDIAHLIDTEERDHPDWNSARTENMCRTRLAIKALVHLQRDSKIWEYVNRNLGEIIAENDEQYEEDMRSRFEKKSAVYTQEVLDMLDWKHYVMLYHEMHRLSGLPHVMVFDNLDWLQITIIQGEFIYESLDVVRELRNEGMDVKAIICVRDENVAYFSYNAGASTKMFQIRFNQEDYLVPGVINHFDLEVGEGDFTRQILQRRLSLVRRRLYEHYPHEFMVFDNIINHFWLLEDAMRASLGYFRFQEFCNESLRLMLELVYECTFELINRLRQKDLPDLPKDQESISLQTVRGSLICSLAYNQKTRDIMEAFYRSVINELTDDYCCIYRLILVLLANQKNREPYTFGQMSQHLRHVFPMQSEANIRSALYNLYFRGVHHGELVVIYQQKVIRNPADIDLGATLQITKRGLVFIRTIMINFDFFKGVVAYQSAKRPLHILYDMAPDQALKKAKEILKIVRGLSKQHVVFIQSTIYPNLLRYKNGDQKPFETYKRQGLSLGDHFHLERVCDNHKLMLKSYITECLRGPNDCVLVLSRAERSLLGEVVQHDWISSEYPESKGSYNDTEVAKLIERLPEQHPVRRLWQDVYLAYGPIKETMSQVREMGWPVT